MIDYDNHCPICIEEFEDDGSGNLINYAITKCGHKFCLSCIIRHGKRKNLCPLCRQEFLNPVNFSPKAFESPRNIFNSIQNDTEILQRFEINYNITSNFDNTEIEVENWYFGERENTMENNPRAIENVYYPDASYSLYYRQRNSPFSGRTRNASYFDYEEDISSGSEYHSLLEDDDENTVNIETRSRDISNNFYDEALSLTDSDNEENVSEDSSNEFII